MEKKFYESKTFWINFLAFIGGIAFAIQGNLIEGGAVTIWSMVQVALRFVTEKKIVF